MSAPEQTPLRELEFQAEVIAAAVSVERARCAAIVRGIALRGASQWALSLQPLAEELARAIEDPMTKV